MRRTYGSPMTSANGPWIIESTKKKMIGSKAEYPVTLDDHFLTITPLTRLSKLNGGRGDKRITLSSIQAVQLHPPTRFLVGFIEFTILGAAERQSPLGKRRFEAVKNENAITFSKQDAEAFTWLRDAVLARIANRDRPVPEVSSVVDELTRLCDLYERGVLSEDEFRAAKARALDAC